MSKLTIKSGCVEAVFKRGRARAKDIERTQPPTSEQPAPAAEAALRDAECDIPQQMAQSLDDDKSSGK